MLHSHYHYLISGHFHHPRQKSVPIKQSLPTPSSFSPWQLFICFLPLWIYVSWTFHINGIIWHVAFCVWIISLIIMFSRYRHVMIGISTSLLTWLHNIPLYGHTTFCLSTHQLVDIWVIFTSYLWWIMLLWTFLSGYISGRAKMSAYSLPGIRVQRGLRHVPSLLSK